MSQEFQKREEKKSGKEGPVEEILAEIISGGEGGLCHSSQEINTKTQSSKWQEPKRDQIGQRDIKHQV